MKNLSKILMTIMLTGTWLVCPVLTWAESFEDAEYAHNADAHKVSFSMFEKLAEQDDARAQFYLGHMYREGEGVKASSKKAAKWLEKSAALGNDHARVMLGYMYWTGEGVRESEEQAFELFKLASENDHEAGRYYLARMYYGGYFVEKDKQEAFNLFNQVFRLKGWPADIRDDSVKGHFWNMTSGGDLVDYIYDMRTKGGFKETFTAKSAAAKKTYDDNKQLYIDDFDKWFEKKQAADKAKIEGDVAAAGRVENGISAYHSGDYLHAHPILLAHANNGHMTAQTYLGLMYRDGLGVAQNDGTANEWFLKAGENGSGEAYYYYSGMAYNYRVPNLHANTNRWGAGWEAMNSSAELGYQPAIDYLQKSKARKQAEQEAEQLERERLLRESADANAETDQARRIRLKKEFDDQMDDIRLGRCRNPYYYKVNGEQRVSCD